MDTTNIDRALEAVQAEQGTPVRTEELSAYVGKIDKLSEAVKALRLPHARAIASAADKASREKKAARIRQALELLEAKEAVEREAAA